MAVRAKRSTTTKKAAPKKTAKEAPKKERNPKRTETVKSSVKSAPLVKESKPSESATTNKERKNTRQRNLGILAALALVLGLLYYFKDLFVVATVNGRPVTRLAVIQELERENGKSVVDNLVTKSLIEQEAAKKGITVSSDDVNAELSKIETDLQAQGQTLDQVLQTQGLTKSDVEENLRIKLYIEKILADKVQVSEDDVKKYYEDNKSLYGNSKYEDVKSQIESSLKQQKLQEQYQTWLDDLKSKSTINYFKSY